MNEAGADARLLEHLASLSGPAARPPGAGAAADLGAELPLGPGRAAALARRRGQRGLPRRPPHRLAYDPAAATPQGPGYPLDRLPRHVTETCSATANVITDVATMPPPARHRSRGRHPRSAGAAGPAPGEHLADGGYTSLVHMERAGREHRSPHRALPATAPPAPRQDGYAATTSASTSTARRSPAAGPGQQGVARLPRLADAAAHRCKFTRSQCSLPVRRLHTSGDGKRTWAFSRDYNLINFKINNMYKFFL